MRPQRSFCYFRLYRLVFPLFQPAFPTLKTDMILEVHLKTWYHESRISKTGEHASVLSLAGSVVQHSFILLKTSCLALNWGELRCYPRGQGSYQRALSLTGSFCWGHLRPVHSTAIVPSLRALWAELWLLKPGVESSHFFLPEFRFQWNKFLSILILLIQI